jgi:O-antigen/teichoic acid export membrane protein
MTIPRQAIPFVDAWLGPRGRLILQTGSWSLVAKAAAAANLFISVPFVLHALGPVEFGAWATLVSLVVFAGFLDFGFGNGTMNLVAAAHGRGFVEEVAAIVQEGRRTLAWIAVSLAIVVAVAAPWVPWYRLLGLPPSLADNCRLASMAVLFSIVLAVPLNLANRVQLGLGRGDRAFRWQAAGQLVTLGLVILLARAKFSFSVLTAAAVFTPLLASFANTVILLRDPLFARPSERRLDLAHRIRREGLLFFVMQLSAALAFSADLPLISALRDPAQAGDYAITQRLFSAIPLGLSLVWAPLWPTYRHALAAGHHAWAAQTLKRSVVMAICIAGILGILIAAGFDWITSFWLHGVLAVAPLLLAGFAIWSVLEAAGTALATFLNAASVMRFQVLSTSAFALLCFGCKAWIVARSGINWLPWVTITTWSLTTALPFLWFRKRILAEAFNRKY